MSSRNNFEWNKILESVDGELHENRVRQQNVFRLFQAIRNDNMEAVEEYVDGGVSIDTPLLFSELDGGPPRAEQFKFAEIQGLKSITALGWVAGRGDLNWVKYLLEKFDADYNVLFSEGRDACWVAMEMRQHEVFRYLLEHGASENFKRSDSLLTPRLIQATKNSDLESVRALIQRKVKVNSYDLKGRTAIHYNFEKNPYSDEDEVIATLLVDWGGFPTAQDKDGVTPADLAHTDFHIKLLKQYDIEKKLEVVIAPQVQEPKNDDIIRLEPGDPGIPQLQKPPVFKNPRF